MEKALFYALIFVLGFVAVSLVSFWLVVRPPRLVISATPEQYHLPARDVLIPTADGLKLSGWFIPGEDTRSSGAALVLLHGYPADKADMLTLARALHPSFSLLLMDLRYFGKSGGRFTTLGLKERDDLKRTLDFLSERGYEQIGVFGFSLGGAVGIMTAAEDSRIAALAAYAPFADLRLIGQETYARLWLLKYPLVELLIFWAELFFGGSITDPSPFSASSKLSVPVFIIASRADEQISFRHAELLRAALRENPQVEFYFLERGLHGELPLDFEERLRRFFLNHLPGS